MTRLLVSVRSAAEAEAALAGGADVIDVKEPANGSLGRAADRTIAEVVALVAGRRPVSAALGEWCESGGDIPPLYGLSYLKWGFSRIDSGRLAEVAGTFDRLRAAKPACRLVTVAYADWESAAAPPPEALGRLACAGRWGPFLLDTWQKDGATLLDRLPLSEVAALVEHCRANGVPVALAGSLGLREMERLLPLRPDWLAVRGAACRGGRRTATVDEDEVRRLADWLAASRIEKAI
jgi:(5-formylfuran-3-yl)methyl phosphate synthase